MSQIRPDFAIRESLQPQFVNTALLLIAVAIGLFFAYLMMDDIFFKSVLQFAAFASFAGGFYTFYRAVDDRITVEIFQLDTQDAPSYRLDFISGDRLLDQQSIEWTAHAQPQRGNNQFWLPVSPRFTILFEEHTQLQYRDRALHFSQTQAEQFCEMLSDQIKPEPQPIS
ncbi:MAG: hypothetical protein ACQETE_09280 [Bacteroidota bacterium]